MLDVIDEAIEAGLLLRSVAPAGAIGSRTISSARRCTTSFRRAGGAAPSAHRRRARAIRPAVDEHLAELAFHFVQATVRPDGTPTTTRRSGARQSSTRAERAIKPARALAYEEAARLYGWRSR